MVTTTSLMVSIPSPHASCGTTTVISTSSARYTPVSYTHLSDYDPKNALDIEKFLNRKEKIHPDDTFIMVDADSLPSA